MHQVKQVFASTPVRAAVVMLALGLAGCSSFENLAGGDKIDYRGAARKTNSLEVPPDLTPLARDGRYLPQASISANALQKQQGVRTDSTAGGPLVAPNKVGEVRLVRDGANRWLVTPMAPEVLFPKLRQFWTDNGFTLASESPEAGVMETEWAENRAKLPQDIIRNTIGKVFDSLYSTGERDKFRTRIERGVNGTEITISHRGLEEIVIEKNRDGNTLWTARPTDPQLEAVFLSRLMVALGASDEAAKTAVAVAATPAPTPTVAAKARLVPGQAGATLQVDDNSERTWRRVGLALDRSGFTVEDRDRAQQVYFVRYADPKTAGKEEASFFSRLFGGKDAISLARFRIAVKAAGAGAQISVLNDQGSPDNSANAQRIAELLVEELKY